MDPNEALKVIRELVAEILTPLGDNCPAERATRVYKAQAQELADYVNNLDTWLSTGGFPPQEWPGRGQPPMKCETQDLLVNSLEHYCTQLETEARQLHRDGDTEGEQETRVYKAQARALKIHVLNTRTLP